MRLIALLLFLVSCTLQANALKSSLNLQRILQADNISIDGVLDEPAWQDAEPFSQFQNQWPLADGDSALEVEGLVMLTETDLLIGVKIFRPLVDATLLSLNRDNDDANWQSDSFQIILDVEHKSANGFLFGINSSGAQYDTILTRKGDVTSSDKNWNAIWHAETQESEQFWVAEIAIPLRVFSRGFNQNSWGINFATLDMRSYQFSTWSEVPVTANIENLDFTGTLVLNEAPASQDFQVQYRPYVKLTESSSEALLLDQNAVELGGDIELVLGNGMSADLSLNPDFSDAQVDDLIINLTRFDINLPEQRNFFIADSELYADFGSDSVKPFLTRSVGIEAGQALDIEYGAKLKWSGTGGVNAGLMRVSAENTAGDVTDYSIGSLLYSSNAGLAAKALFTETDTSLANESVAFSADASLQGLELDYLSPDSVWTLFGKYHYSDNGTQVQDGSFINIGGRVTKETWQVTLGHERVDAGFSPQLGFVPRLFHYNAQTQETEVHGYSEQSFSAGYFIRPAVGDTFANIAFRFNADKSETLTGDDLEFNKSFSASRLNNDSSSYSLELSSNDINLIVPTQLDSSLGIVEEGDYQNHTIGGRYASDIKKQFAFSAFYNTGTFYTGRQSSFGGSLIWKWLPWVTTTASVSRDKVELGELGNNEFDLYSIDVRGAVSHNMQIFGRFQKNVEADLQDISLRFFWDITPLANLVMVLNYSDYGYSDQDGTIATVKFSYVL